MIEPVTGIKKDPRRGRKVPVPGKTAAQDSRIIPE